MELDVVDRATLGQQRDDLAASDIYITHSPFLPEPVLTDMYVPTSRLGWSEPDKNAIHAAFTTETDQAERQELFAQLQEKLFEDAGSIKIGGFNALQGQRKGLEGVVPSLWPYFWNAQVN